MLKMTTCTRVIAISLAGALFLGGCGMLESNQDRIDKARAALAEHELRTAEIQLKNVLQKESDNGEAWLLLARVSLASSAYADAVEQFRRARDRGLDVQRFAIPMARALLGDAKPEPVLDLLKPETAADNAQRAEILSLRGEAYLGLGKADPAAKAFDKALAAQPDFADALIGQSRLAQRKGDDEAATQLIERALKAHPKDAGALEAKGLLAYNRDNCARAMPAFRKLLSIEHPDLSVQRLFASRSFLADCQIRNDQFDAAEAQVATLMKMGPNTGFANYLQALVDVRHKDYEQATIHLQQFLKVAPDNIQGLTLLASVKIAQDDPRSAELYLNEAIAQAPGSARVVGKLATLYLQRDQADRAVALLQDARQDNPDDPDLRAMLAEALVRSGDTQAALDAVRDSTGPGGEADPNLQMDVARAMARAGDARAALALLDGVKANQPGDRLKAALLKISVYLQNKSVDKAVAAAEKLVDDDPKDVRRLRLLASTYVAAGRNDDARAALERALAADSDAISVTRDLGLLALREQHYADAEKRFHDVLEQRPDDLRALVGLTQSSALQGKQDAALKWLQKAYHAHPDNRQVQVALARFYLSTQQTDKANALLKKAVAAHPDDAGLRRVQGGALLASSQTGPGLDSLKKAVELAPDEPGYRLDLGRAQLAAGKPDAAVKTLQTLREDNPDFLAAIPTLAVAQLRAGNPDAAMASAESLKQATGNDIATNTLKGDLLGSQGQYDQAAQAYASAYAAAPNRTLATNLFEARRRGSATDPARSLVDWLDKHPEDTATAITLAQWYQFDGQTDAAVRQYRDVLASNPDNIVALNNLALVYHDQGNDKALATARRAHEAAPGNPAVTDTLGWITLERGQVGPALKLLREAASAAPQAGDIQYHLAVALARTDNSGDNERARQILTDLLESKQPFESRSQARALLDELDA